MRRKEPGDISVNIGGNVNGQVAVGDGNVQIGPRGAADRPKGPRPEKVSVLFLAANPKGTDTLRLGEEAREIREKIRAAEYRDSLELISRWAVRSDDLLQALLEHQPHIVHFSGHGTATEEILLEDAQGRPKPVSKAALSALFGNLKGNVQIVLLNACYSRPQAEAITQSVPCAVGMRRPIGDEAAIVFAASFYRVLGFGRSVAEAFELAKTALMLRGIPEEQTPDLLLREGVDASRLVLVRPEQRL